MVTAQMMGKLNSIPGVFTFLRPFPVLEISTGVTSQNQGQYAFAVSGANPEQVYDVSQKLMGKLMQYPGFLTVSSDFYNNTPNLNIELRRDQAKTYGVSEARILSLLRNAYSQNYLYLIKKPEDQYQVILEMEDSARANPQDRLSQSFLAFGVEVRVRLVEHDQERVAVERASERDALCLSGRQRAAVFADDGVIALGQVDDEIVHAGRLRRRDHRIGVRRIFETANVLRHRAV